MRRYTIADTREPSWGLGQHLVFEIATLFVAVLLLGLLAGFGDSGLLIAFIAAPIIVGGVLWRLFSRGDRQKEIAEHGRYYCGACWQHFEGDSLRQITQ